jgi:DNA invertase Pin-like site-specific DNA recombinase
MPGQTFAYLRVSKLDQDLEKNKSDILKLANEAHLGHVSFIEEKIGSSISWRKRHIALVWVTPAVMHQQPGSPVFFVA